MELIILALMLMRSINSKGHPLHSLTKDAKIYSIVMQKDEN